MLSSACLAGMPSIVAMNGIGRQRIDFWLPQISPRDKRGLGHTVAKRSHTVWRGTNTVVGASHTGPNRLRTLVKRSHTGLDRLTRFLQGPTPAH